MIRQKLKELFEKDDETESRENGKQFKEEAMMNFANEALNQLKKTQRDMLMIQKKGLDEIKDVATRLDKEVGF